jgi:hypothetical protein
MAFSGQKSSASVPEGRDGSPNRPPSVARITFRLQRPFCSPIDRANPRPNRRQSNLIQPNQGKKHSCRSKPPTVPRIAPAGFQVGDILSCFELIGFILTAGRALLFMFALRNPQAPAAHGEASGSFRKHPEAKKLFSFLNVSSFRRAAHPLGRFQDVPEFSCPSG